MIRFDQAVDISRSIDEVFAYLADFTHVPDWNYYVHRVTAYDPPRTVAVSTVPGERPVFRRYLDLSRTAGGGSRVHDRWELDTGQPQLIQRVATARIKAAVADNLALLKHLLEHGHARLQDGRVVALDTPTPSSDHHRRSQ